jgi:hypothetical protein
MTIIDKEVNNFMKTKLPTNNIITPSEKIELFFEN